MDMRTKRLMSGFYVVDLLHSVGNKRQIRGMEMRMIEVEIETNGGVEDEEGGSKEDKVIWIELK